MKSIPVDNDSEKKSISASPAEIAKKAANKTRDLWGDMEAGELESIFLSAIKEASAPLSWVPIEKDKPPLCADTLGTDGFFLVLLHDPTRDAEGQYRIRIHFGTVGTNVKFWTRIPGWIPSPEKVPK